MLIYRPPIVHYLRIHAVKLRLLSPVRVLPRLIVCHLLTRVLGNSEARSRLVILLWLPLLQAFYHAFYESSPRPVEP